MKCNVKCITKWGQCWGYFFRLERKTNSLKFPENEEVEEENERKNVKYSQHSDLQWDQTDLLTSMTGTIEWLNDISISSFG